jgi:mono/diheme cytochrome c family protein
MFKFLNLSLLVLLVFSLTSCTPQPKKVVPADYKKGQDYFHRVCSNCHGPDAMGGQTKAPRLIDSDYVPSEFSDEDIKETILNGTDKMPPQKANVTPEEISEIIKYLRYSQKAANIVTDSDDDSDVEDEESDQVIEDSPTGKKTD